VTIVPGAGHAPHREAPQLTVATIADFINRILVTHGEGRTEQAA
jgi:hypothetical protein